MRSKIFCEIKLYLSTFSELNWQKYQDVNKGLLGKLQCLQNTNLSVSDYRLSKTNLHCQVAVVTPGLGLDAPIWSSHQGFSAFQIFQHCVEEQRFGGQRDKIYYLLPVMLGKFFSLSSPIKKED